MGMFKDVHYGTFTGSGILRNCFFSPRHFGQFFAETFRHLLTVVLKLIITLVINLYFQMLWLIYLFFLIISKNFSL